MNSSQYINLVEDNLWNPQEQPRTIFKDYCYGRCSLALPQVLRPKRLASPIYPKKWPLYFQTKISNKCGRFSSQQKVFPKEPAQAWERTSVAPGRSLKTELTHKLHVRPSAHKPGANAMRCSSASENTVRSFILAFTSRLYTV